MRRLLAVSACAVFLFTAACRRSPSTGVFVDPAFGPLVNSDVKIMAGVRMEKIRATPLYQKLESQFPLSMLDEFSKQTGLNPRRDIWEILFTSNGKDSLIMMRGRFTVGELEPKIEHLGAQRTKYKEFTLMGDDRNALVFLNPGVAVAGSRPALERMIDRRNQGGGIPEAFQQKLKTILAENQIWAISTGGLTIPESAISRSDAQSMLSNLVGFVKDTAIAIHADSGLHLKSDISCVSEEGSQRVKDALKGMIGFARLGTSDKQPELLPLWDAFKVDKEQDTVHVTANLDATLTDQLLKLLPTPGKRQQ